jgi:hypothetical protein
MSRLRMTARMVDFKYGMTIRIQVYTLVMMSILKDKHTPTVKAKPSNLTMSIPMTRIMMSIKKRTIGSKIMLKL